jgi:hypothetical protein
LQIAREGIVAIKELLLRGLLHNGASRRRNIGGFGDGLSAAAAGEGRQRQTNHTITHTIHRENYTLQPEAANERPMEAPVNEKESQVS